MNKKLNLFDITSLGAGTIIGAGVFSMMGYGIAYTGRGIVIALFLVVMQSIRYPILASVFEVEGGMYGINALTNPKVVVGFNAASDMLFKMATGSVTVMAITQYLAVLFPVVNDYFTIVCIVLATVFYLIAIVGDKFAAYVQNIMVILMYVALGLFVVFGFLNINPGAYAGEPMLVNGFGGLMMVAALMSYTCNGFQYVINVAQSAENPKRNIPLGFFLSALVAAALYALIGFAATHVYSYGNIAGKNLGDIAKLMMRNGLYNFFVIGGALFALSTSMLGGISSGYRPVQSAARDGWFPAVLGKETKRGTPYVFGLLYLLCIIPLILGIDLNDMVTMSLIPMGILFAISNYYSMKLPETHAEQWKASGIKMSAGMYRFLLWLSIAASIVLVLYCFLSNSMKVATIIVTGIVFAYGYLRSKSSKVKIHVQAENKK